MHKYGVCFVEEKLINPHSTNDFKFVNEFVFSKCMFPYVSELEKGVNSTRNNL